MKILLFSILVLSTQEALQAKDSIHFNAQSQVIPPDEVHLARGLEHEQDGFRTEAINSFTKASEYGNEHARFFNGLLFMQDAKYVEALAWLYLVNAEKINRVDKIQKLKAAAMAELTDEELLKAEEMLLTLERTHNSTQGRINRDNWRNSLKFTGSNSRGKITPRVKIYANTWLELGPDGSIEYLQATPINSFQLRRDLEDFVFKYQYDLPNGTVELHDLETEE